MPRGFEWGIYIDDFGRVWRLRVDSDYVLQDERGWVPANPEETFPLPRQWKPRVAVGVDQDGRRRKAVVATTVADLWTGVVRTFEIEGNDGVNYPVAVTQLFEERRV